MVDRAAARVSKAGRLAQKQMEVTSTARVMPIYKAIATAINMVKWANFYDNRDDTPAEKMTAARWNRFLDKIIDERFTQGNGFIYTMTLEYNEHTPMLTYTFRCHTTFDGKKIEFTLRVVPDFIEGFALHYGFVRGNAYSRKQYREDVEQNVRNALSAEINIDHFLNT